MPSMLSHLSRFILGSSLDYERPTEQPTAKISPDMLVHSDNFSNLELKAEISLQLWDLPGQYSEFPANQGYRMRSYFKPNKTLKQKKRMSEIS